MLIKITKPIKLSVLFFGVLILHMGCTLETVVVPTPTNTIDAIPQNTSTVAPTTVLPQESQATTTATILFATSPPVLPSETPIPTDADELEPPRTVLPLPTIPTDEVEAFVLNLIRGNEDPSVSK